jgi:hypothetical protein
MASTAPQNASLPLLYSDLLPLSSIEHASWKTRAIDNVRFLRTQHAIPVTVDEFAVVQRNYPIIFSVGDNPVPLALMGLNEGVNTFVDEEGKINENVYLPAYVRRYPFLLARLRPEAEELSLCFDPTQGAIGPYDDGEALFQDGQPTDAVKRILGFCEEFEQSGLKTGQFMAELAEHKLLIDGEVSIQPQADSQPFIYRGFQMVDETKLRDLRGDVLRKMMQNGMLPLIHAHLFSLQIMSEIFGRQMAQGFVTNPPAA